MYYLNKIVGAILNPLGIGLLLMLLTVWLVWLKKRRATTPLASIYICGLLSIVWMWVWSSGFAGRMIGLSLEREFPPQLAEQMPQADAIVVLGGGVSLNTNACPYAKLFSSADRVWHGARLFRAGKAPRVFVTCEADALFMADLGVPRTAITIGDSARNTEEEARLFASRGVKSVLLVTSAWHMRRAKLMYEKYAKGVAVIPVAADHINMTLFNMPLEFKDFVPDPMMIGQNASMFKEWIAYWGYRWLRK